MSYNQIYPEFVYSLYIFCNCNYCSNAFMDFLHAYRQGCPEKLRGLGQRVKVGPLTQVVR